MRSCYKSKWAIPLDGVNLLVKGRYYFNNAPFLDREHFFGSRNWTAGDFEGIAPLGERSGRQEWFNGSFPVRPPDAQQCGASKCIPTAAWLDITPCCPIFAHAGDQLGWWRPELSAHGEIYLIIAGPFATYDEAAALMLHLDQTFCPVDTYLGWNSLPGAYTIPADGWYANADFVCFPGLGGIPPPPNSCPCIFGVPQCCWKNPPAFVIATGGEVQSGGAHFSWQFTSSGGEVQSGAAGFAHGSMWDGSGGEIQAGDAQFNEDFAWTGNGGEVQSGAALVAGAVNWIASGGEVQSGSAAFAGAVNWIAAGGELQSGAAAFAEGFAWAGSGGQKESGAGSISQSASWTASGGEKENGAARIIAWLFCQSTDTDTTCDASGFTNGNLDEHVGTSSLSHSTGSTSYVNAIQWNKAFVGVSGDYKVSLSVATDSFSGVYSFRLEILDSSCFALATSAYTSDFNTTGVKTATFTMTWPAGGARIRISVRHHKAVSNTVLVINCDANSFVQVPTQ